VITPGALAIGILAAFVVGFAKTALPGSGLLAITLIATVATGRLLPGASLPILLAGDVFAVTWYRRHARWDLLRPLSVWVGAGYLLGMAFFVVVGEATRALEVTIGLIIVVMVAIHAWRLYRASGGPSTSATPAYGTAGGFTTFVANTGGPVMNTYLAGLRLDKEEMIGTLAVFYLMVNLVKIPLYVGLGEWSAGGRFFTWESLGYDALILPGVGLGVLVGRRVFRIIPQRTFLVLVLVLSALGAAKLLV